MCYTVSMVTNTSCTHARRLAAMATPRISARLPPNIDPTKSSLAYGNRQLIKLVGKCGFVLR